MAQETVLPDHCAACGAELPPWEKRTRALTCNETCHQQFIDQVVQRFGEVREIIHIETGKTHLVPTRVILEHGIKGTDLAKYPTKDMKES